MSAIVEVMVWTLCLSFVLAIIYRVLTNPTEMKRIKSNMKEIQEKVKKAQKSGDMQQVNALTSEMLKGSQQQFAQNMKPMMVSMLLFFVFIGWLNAQYTDLMVRLPITFVTFVWSFPPIALATEYSYLGWYIIITIPATFFFRKMLGVE